MSVPRNSIAPPVGSTSRTMQFATVDFPLPAQRPLYTVLDCSRASARGVELRSWQDAVRAYLAAPVAPRRAANGS